MTGRRDPEIRHSPSTAAGCLAIVLTLGVVPVGFFSLRVAARVVQAPIIDALYGPDAHAHGLHVIGRQGQLSNGKRLPTGWNMALAFFTFLLSMPGWLAYLTVLAFFGLFPPDRRYKKEPTDP